jgi:CubicO group peptidase (beta-lactamase class C family)
VSAFTIGATSAGEMVTAEPKKWAPLKEQLDGWVLTENFGVTVGNSSHGTLFEYTHGNFSSTRTQCSLASSSKWPLAMMFVGLVADGTIESLEVKANKYVSWWSKDPSDLKSKITLRHLLSFTSGFGDGVPGQENSTETCMDDPSQYPNITTYDECAQSIYSNTNLSGTPGSTYTYNSVHLQLAGSIALAASNSTSIQHIIDKYLIKAYGFESTTCEIPTRDMPQLAICLDTVARDYAKFLHAQLAASVVPAHLVRESEKDYTPFRTSNYTLYGNYGFGHFLECYDSVAGFTEECALAKVHADPGAFGYYPLIDRKNNYFMQISAYETGKYYPRSGIPEYLRLLIKPLVDHIITSDDPLAGQEFEHHTTAYNALSLVDVNYIVNCYVNPKSCE